MMATEEEVVRERVIKILRSSICAQINFVANNIKIEGKDYSMIAGLISNPVSNGITIEIDPIYLSTNGKGASYNSGSNVFTFMTPDFGSNLYEQQTIIHEATHAAVHNTIRNKIKNLNNEIVAYIAGLAYYNMAGGSADFFKKPVFIEADKLAERMLLSGSGIYTFQPDELTGITQAIKNNPIYSDYNKESTGEADRREEFLEPVGRWDVKCGPDQPDNSLWQWTYIFRSGGKLDWYNAGDPKTGGSGTWVFSKSELVVKTRFKSGTTEEWKPPMNNADNDGSRMSGTAYMPKGKFRLWAYKAA